MKHATITLLDEVNVRVDGLDTEHHKLFWNAYGIYTENYFFNPKHKLGAWDGKIRYYHMDGATYFHLLEEIMPKIVALGYDVKLDDRRDSIFVSPPLIDNSFFSNITWPDTDEPVILYDHQVRVVNSLIADGSGLAIAATGAGKTLCCGALCSSYNKFGIRMLVIVPSQDLIEQTRSDFEWLQLDVGEYSGAKKDLEHATVVSTWQALQHNPTIINSFQGIIVDEAHGLTGPVLQSLLLQTGGKIAHRFGVTGTLPKPKTDELSVKLAVGPVKAVVPANELIELGILAKLDIHIQQLEEDFHEKYKEFLKVAIQKKTYTQFKDSYFPDFSAEKSYLQRNKVRNAYIAKRIQELSLQGNTFVLVDGIDVGKNLANAIPGAVFVHGNDKSKVRKQIYKMFNTENNLVVIATVNIASTGINIKRIYNLCLIDIGKSFTRVIQSIGRGLRVAADKDHVDVFDFCSDLKYSRKHLTERQKYYKEAQYPFNKKVVQYLKNNNNEVIC